MFQHAFFPLSPNLGFFWGIMGPRGKPGKVEKHMLEHMGGPARGSSGAMLKECVFPFGPCARLSLFVLVLPGTCFVTP